MDNTKLPIALKVTVAYLIVIGSIGLIVTLLGLGSSHPEFEAQTTAYKVGTYLRESVFNIAFISAGVAIIFHKKWGCIIGLIALVINTIYAGNSFAWGFQNGPPTNTIFVISYIVNIIWNGIWFYILFRKTTMEVLNE